MKNILKIIIPMMLLYSCSMNSALRKSFTGKEPVSLEKHFGKPTTIIPRNSDTLMVYERKKSLGATEISQGKLTLDPIRTPKVTKTERYLFTIQKGKIVKTRYEKMYEKDEGKNQKNLVR